MLRVLCCCVLLSGCAPTAVVLDVTLGAGEATPSSLTVSVFDPHHALLFGRAIGTHLPGRLTLNDLPSVAAPLRIALDGSGGLEAGVSVSVAPGSTAHGAAQLSARTRDGDGDGVPDVIDDCPTVANPMQQNSAGGLEGDACRGAGDLGVGIGDMAAPPGSDLSIIDLGGVNTSCPANAIVCDGFESGFGSVWFVQNDAPTSITTDGIHAFKGGAAAHFHSPATSQTYAGCDIGEEKSQPQADTWVRVYVYVPTATEPYKTTLVQMYQNNAGFNYVGLDLDDGGHLELFDTQQPSYGKSATAPFPTDRWVCLEWHFHQLPSGTDLAGASGESQVWLDGTDVPELHVSTQLQASYAYGVLMLGMQINNTLPGGGDVWFDEFAAGASRLGCE